MCVQYQHATEHASARHHYSVECRCLPFSLSRLTQAAPFLGTTWQCSVRDIAYRAGETLPKEQQLHPSDVVVLRPKALPSAVAYFVLIPHVLWQELERVRAAIA